MEIVKGALPSVLSKLGGLLINEYNLQKGLKGEIMVLETELERMQGALEKLSSIPPEQVDKQDKIWAKHVRELSYDIEDSIDAFMVHDKGSDDLGFKNFIDRSFHLWYQFCNRRNIATEIRGIKRQARELSEQSVRYKIDTDVARPATIDTRIFARYKKVTDLVGIDEQRDALIKILIEGDQVSKQQYNIVSIVGFGGLGKTTLANVVYEKLRGQFDCSAFVSVSQNPDMEKLFIEMFRQLADKKLSASTNAASIDAIREYLVTKSLTSLEELEVKVTNDDSSDNIMEELGRLTELRVLSIDFRIKGNKRWEKSVVECLCKLTKLRSLHMGWFAFELNLDGWATPRHLHRFDTRFSLWLSKLPAWMEHSSLLVDLSFIYICLTKLQQEDLEILGRLPALRILELEGRNQSGFVFGSGSFPSLLDCRLPRYIAKPVAFPVVFQEGAMPRLERLEFAIHVWETREIASGCGGLEFGLGNLPSLQHVELFLKDLEGVEGGGGGDGEGASGLSGGSEGWVAVVVGNATTVD
nr:unnamed protein product [Digitaria exilis]